MAERKAEYDAPEQLTDDKKRKAALADALKTIEKNGSVAKFENQTRPL